MGKAFRAALDASGVLLIFVSGHPGFDLRTSGTGPNGY
jgi:hypothetical protein